MKPKLDIHCRTYQQAYTHARDRIFPAISRNFVLCSEFVNFCFHFTFPHPFSVTWTLTLFAHPPMDFLYRFSSSDFV